MTLRTALAALAALAVAPVLLRAPDPTPAEPGRPTTLDEVVDQSRASGLAGWDLVDHATALVHERYRHYSAWHLWESPAAAFARGRGMSNQVNGALARVLTRLGFEVVTVHAARVHQDRGPWWHSGHTWLRVTIAGRTRDVCAVRASNRAGHVAFTPVTAVRPFTPLTYLDTTLGLVPFVVEAVWRSTLTASPPPRWLWRPFGEPVLTSERPAERP